MIRTAKTDDFERIREIYAGARQFMAAHGNPDQWGLCYPSDALVLQDIREQTLYVITGHNRIVGVFYFHIGPDPTYARIEDGAWLSEEPYGTIHRIASDGTTHGILKQTVAYCEERILHLRIDTHPDNLIMQRQIVRCGFTRTGIIYAEDGSVRYAYEKC